MDFFFFPVSESHRKKQPTRLFLLSKPGRVSQPAGLAGPPCHAKQRARHRCSSEGEEGQAEEGHLWGHGAAPVRANPGTRLHPSARARALTHTHTVRLLLVWLGLFVFGLFSFSPVNPGLITVAFSLATCLENLTDVPAPSSCHSLADSSVRTGKEGLEARDLACASTLLVQRALLSPTAAAPGGGSPPR